MRPPYPADPPEQNSQHYLDWMFFISLQKQSGRLAASALELQDHGRGLTICPKWWCAPAQRVKRTKAVSLRHLEGMLAAEIG